MIPQFPNGHPVFDKWPVTENYPCPISKSRLKLYQRQIDRIAGKASNGKSNVRVIWASDPAVAMHIINGEPKARYGIRTDQYETTRTDPESGLEIVEFIDVDICPPRFLFEQYHTPEEAAFNPASPQIGSDDAGFYTHLFTVAYHDETCCDGREAFGDTLCFGAYQEPSETHLQRLQQSIRLRDQEGQYRMIGQRLSEQELQADLLHTKTWRKKRDADLEQGYYEAALDALKLHGWRASNTDGGKRSKYHFLQGA